MKEDKDLLKKYGKKNPFTVPEGYFQNFNERLMEQLPEKKSSPNPKSEHGTVSNRGSTWPLCSSD